MTLISGNSHIPIDDVLVANGMAEYVPSVSMSCRVRQQYYEA